MAIVASEDDKNEVIRAMEDADANTYAWLGGRAAVGAWTWERRCGVNTNCGGGHFHAVASDASYTNWAPDEPSTGGGIGTCADEVCLKVSFEGKWSAVECNVLVWT